MPRPSSAPPAPDDVTPRERRKARDEESTLPPLPGAPVHPGGPSPAGFRAGFHGLLPYLVAGLLFITISVIEPRFMLNWSPGLVLMLLVCWLVPAWWRRRRR